MNVKYDFFISYCREEITTMAYPLYRLLTELGFNIWMDRDRIMPGCLIYEAIDKAINASTGVIAIIAEPYLSRPWTIHELELTLSLEKGQQEILLPIFHGIAPEKVWSAFPALNGRAYEPYNDVNLNYDSMETQTLIDRLLCWFFRKAAQHQESDYNYQWLYNYSEEASIGQLLILLEQCHVSQSDLRTNLLGYSNAIRYIIAILLKYDTVNIDNKTYYTVANRYCSSINNKLFCFGRSFSNTKLLTCRSILTYMCERLKAVLNHY